MTERGYILFDCHHQEGPPPPESAVRRLNEARSWCRDRGLIGQLPNGIGFGNLSVRGPAGTFYVSASGTGGIARTGPEHYTTVLSWSVDENRVVCRGPKAASSESLTHAACYEAGRGVGAVIHIHDRETWRTLRGRLPTTPEQAEAGTPAMAHATRRTVEAAPTGASSGLLVMGGHPEGLLAWASDLEGAVRALEAALASARPADAAATPGVRTRPE